MDFKLIKKLIDKKIIYCGRKFEEDGIVRFERVDPAQLESLPEEERAYATSSMGRAIFSIDSEGKVHNYKGVDSHLETTELGPMNLVNANAIEHEQGPDKHKISAVVFNGKKPEIRINGTSPLEDIEIEGDINKALESMGVKVPSIGYIREIPQEYSLRHGLPIKVSGSIEELKSDYAKEDDERKKRLETVYGKDYIQQLGDGQRPETMREYLQRVGFLDSDEVQEFVKSLGYEIEDFVSAVDSSYSRGQRYGQAERVMESPFRISDIETCMAQNDVEGLQAIFEFSEGLQNGFENNLARTYGKNIAILMNNGWECENIFHRQDFSLAGEFCDDAYFDIIEYHKEATEKHKDKPYIADSLFAEKRERFTGQVMHIASCVKVIQDAMRMLGKDDSQIDSVLNDFVESFVSFLNFEAISKVFNTDRDAIEKEFLRQFSGQENWLEKLSVQFRKEGKTFDDAALNAHKGNEEFYKKVSRLISNKFKEREVKKEDQDLKPITLFDRLKNGVRKLLGYREGKEFVNSTEPLIKDYSEIELGEIANIEQKLRRALAQNRENESAIAGITKDEAKKLLEWVVQKDRMILGKDNLDIKTSSLLGRGGLSQDIVATLLSSMTLSPRLSNVSSVIPGSKLSGHAFNTVSIPIVENDGKVLDTDFLIDATYRQFFLRDSDYSVSGRFVKDRRFGEKAAPLAGYWCEKLKGGNDFANELLRNGFIELTPENAKIYGDSFMLERLKDDEFKKLYPEGVTIPVSRTRKLETGISGEQYISWLTDPSRQDHREINLTEREIETDLMKTPFMIRQEYASKRAPAKQTTDEKETPREVLDNRRN